MRCSPGCVVVSAFAASALVLSGCSSGKQAGPATPSASTSQAAGQTGPVQIGVSPGGVTTSISAPAGSTEEEYYQACHWARVWMSGQTGDPHTLVEPYLAMVQKSPTGENGTWHIPWAKLPPERQAGVIVAAQAAAEDGCD
ncbi:lipoprotein LpqV [Mycobacterium sp.]|uniref:lipoprotein LpqV n=1 Tax=Mycobacterium sp. TaxID=1785 RepID=UPI002BB26273|nr:lipoprotein LpqV [Mycobacterium sp.]HME48204.1 lipoprotein LpqV [Mycobacterium sp.]